MKSSVPCAVDTDAVAPSFCIAPDGRGDGEGVDAFSLLGLLETCDEDVFDALTAVALVETSSFFDFA